MLSMISIGQKDEAHSATGVSSMKEEGTTKMGFFAFLILGLIAGNR